MTSETIRRAECRCGRLSATCEGEPVRISVCHCLDCQRRSGSVFAAQARFPKEKVRIEGEYKSYTHIADSGNEGTFNFCPNCGGQVFYSARPFRETIAVAIGAFADPHFPAPKFSVWESRKHDWVAITGDVDQYD